MERNEGRYTGREQHQELQLALNGDQEVLRRVFSCCTKQLYHTAFRVLGSREDAEDAVQDGLLAAVRNLKSFEGRSELSTWLTRVVFNAALMHRRKNRKHAVTSIDQTHDRDGLSIADRITDPGPNPEEMYAQAEWLHNFQRKLGRLPAASRSALWLRDVQDMSIREAAEAQGISPGTLKSRLHRARRKIVREDRSAGASFRKFPALSRGSGVTPEDACGAANEAIQVADQGFASARAGRAKTPLNGRAMPRIELPPKDGLATETNDPKGSYPEAKALELALPLLFRRS